MSRTPVSRESVISMAMVIADQSGLDAVSMRRVAEALGVVPMALYKHVRDKDDLLNAMVDALIAQFTPVDLSAPWQAELTAALASARQVVGRHPWARAAIETRTQRTRAVLTWMDVLTQLLLAGGLSADLTHHAMHTLGNRIWGFSPELFNQRAPAPAAPPAALTPTDFPGIMAISADAVSRRPGATGCDEDFEFGFALDVILGGIAAKHAAGWTSG